MMTYCIDCDRRPVHARGLCSSCYYRQRRDGVLLPRYRRRGACWCGRQAGAGQNLCMRHYQQARRKGELTIMPDVGRPRRKAA